jgi:hypothetical protein
MPSNDVTKACCYVDSAPSVPSTATTVTATLPLDWDECSAGSFARSARANISGGRCDVAEVESLAQLVGDEI